MTVIRQKIWTYLGPSPSEISLFNHPVAESLSEPANDIKEYLILLIRAMAIKGYVFKPSQNWQEHYMFQSPSAPSWFQNETTYTARPITVNPKDVIETKDQSIFDLLSETSSGIGLLDILSTTELMPDIVVYYDESGNTDYALENIYFPLVKGFNLANSDDIRKLTYLASTSNQFWTNSEEVKKNMIATNSTSYEDFIEMKKIISRTTLSALLDLNNFDFFEQVFSTACNTHVNGRPYVLPVWRSYLPNRMLKGKIADYMLAANMINKTLTRFLTTQAFILISAIKAEKGLSLEGDDMPKIDQIVRTYLMEPDEYLPKGWANDLKKVILAQAYRTMFMATQEALL
jgi:hypothetical protein